MKVFPAVIDTFLQKDKTKFKFILNFETEGSECRPSLELTLLDANLESYRTDTSGILKIEEQPNGSKKGRLVALLDYSKLKEILKLKEVKPFVVIYCDANYKLKEAPYVEEQILIPILVTDQSEFKGQNEKLILTSLECTEKIYFKVNGKVECTLKIKNISGIPLLVNYKINNRGILSWQSRNYLDRKGITLTSNSEITEKISIRPNELFQPYNSVDSELNYSNKYVLSNVTILNSVSIYNLLFIFYFIALYASYRLLTILVRRRKKVG